MSRTSQFSATDVQDIVRAYRDELMPMAQIAMRYHVTRMSIYKILKAQGIETKKGIGGAAQIKLTCPTCGEEFYRVRCIYRKTLNTFCKASCYFEHSKANSAGEVVSPRLTKRKARKVVSQVFALQPDHVVHHADGDLTNNTLANLWVFASYEDHIHYIRGTRTVFPIWASEDILT